MKEKELKPAVDQFLQWMQNLGLLMYRRLNSGVAFVGVPPDKLRKIKLCEPGTFDFEVNLRGTTVFIETKGTRGKLSDDQIAFFEKCLKHGCVPFVVETLEQVQKYLGEIEPKIKEVKVE